MDQAKQSQTSPKKLAHLRKIAKKGGLAMKRKAKFGDPNFYREIGRMGALAKKRRFDSDPEFAKTVQRQNRRAAKAGSDKAKVIYAAGRAVLDLL